MAFRQGVQAEVVLSLALVMVTGTGLLAAILLEINHARVEQLHGLVGRGFIAASHEATFEVNPLDTGRWWRIDGSGRVAGLNVSSGEIDSDSRALGEEALASGEPLVQSGAPWSPIRLAGPRANAPGAIVGRIDAPVSGLVLGGLLLTDVLIFGLFGVTLLGRRVVGPLHRLARNVRELGEGDLPATVPVEGVAEIEELGRAYNEMQEALASRTGALEKAVVDLRTANASLLQAREGLDRAERLAMVGSLAAGVAHEVGNPMGALLAFLEVASRDEGLSEEGRRCLDKASDQGERVRLILRQLLDFSRPPRVEHRPIALGDIARQAIELVSAQKDFADIDFQIDEEEGLEAAIGDESLASQILLNLAINAAAALEGAPLRRIRIELARDARCRRSGEGAITIPPDRADSIVCCVSDSGPGVPPEEQERIFDPFFTTKEPGQGTGLGLANARRLAAEMDGDVELDGEPSPLGGALFRFRLPMERARVAAGSGVRCASEAQETR